MLDVLRFWLERGVDGFRIDALRQLIKDDRFRDNLPNPDHREGDSPTMRCSPSIPRTGPRRTRPSARCVTRWPSMETTGS
jgi:alpha-glucosidase